MKEKPILFSSLMVQAILDDRKTQTRRIVTNLRKPPYEKEDVLWVQENYSLSDNEPETCVFRCNYDDGTSKTVILDMEEYAKLMNRKTPPTKKQPGRFMYKSCSRIRLLVNDVKLERLQDISEEDAIAEGIEAIEDNGMAFYRDYVKAEFQLINPRASFCSLWESIHGLQNNSWFDNPFVWVIKFKKSGVM